MFQFDILSSPMTVIDNHITTVQVPPIHRRLNIRYDDLLLGLVVKSMLVPSRTAALPGCTEYSKWDRWKAVQ